MRPAGLVGEVDRWHSCWRLDRLDEKTEGTAVSKYAAEPSPSAPKEWIRAMAGCPAASISAVTADSDSTM
jgi:hypothetical protein